MNQPRCQAYLTLIKTLLTCPSEEEIAILQANLELLDDDFAEYLREWAAETMPNLDADIAENRANILYNLKLKISSFQQGSHRSNIKIGIACLDIGLTIFTREAYSKKWAMFQNSLGIAYSSRIKGDRGENIERAIAFYEAALQVYTREAFPQNWATTENNLANAYSDRIKGERGENIERAIAFYEAALEVRTRPAFPEDWARTQNNLAAAYSHRIKGERGENIERAIAFYEAALEVHNSTTLPLYCLQTGRNLGNLGFAKSLWETAIFGYEKAIEAVEQSREWIASDKRKREIIEENLNLYEK